MSASVCGNERTQPQKPAATPATLPAKMLTNAIATPSTLWCSAVYMSSPAIPKPKDPSPTPLIRKATFKAPRQSPLGSMLGSVSSDLEFSKAGEKVAGEMEERAS
ncbi:hypothetical protein BDR03DRAFT_995466 [Suillus americanus]|nr:hypothetical protein BDR03DRAFT_995466 [Suillus americanus]